MDHNIPFSHVSAASSILLGIPKEATISLYEISEMNTMVASLYPKECKHTPYDLKRSICCVAKNEIPINFLIVKNFMEKAIPLTGFKLVEELSDPDIRHVSLMVKVKKLQTKLVPIVIVRFFTWLKRTQIRVLGLRPLDVAHQSEDYIAATVLSMIYQANIRAKIISIEVDSNSVGCIPANLRSKIVSQFGGALFHWGVDLTTVLMTLFDDIAKLLPFNLLDLVELFKTDTGMTSQDFGGGENEKHAKKLRDIRHTPMGKAIIPDPNSLLHFQSIVIKAAVFFDVFKTLPPEADTKQTVQNFTSSSSNQLLLGSFSQIYGCFIDALILVQQDGCTFGNAFITLQKLRSIIAGGLTNATLVPKVKDVHLRKAVQAERHLMFLFNSNDFYLGALKKLDNVLKNFVGPHQWVLLQSLPSYIQILKSLDYFAQHNFPIRGVDLFKLASEIKLVHKLITSQMLLRWNQNDFENGAELIETRWTELFELDTEKELVVLPQLVELIFTATPLGVNDKMERIYKDVEHFWGCEVERKGMLKADWASIRAALMMRHNMAHVFFEDIWADPESEDGPKATYEATAAADVGYQPKPKKKKNKKKGKGKGRK